MTCNNPETVRRAMIDDLCDVRCGPYTVVYLNTTEWREWERGYDSEHLAQIKRDSNVRDVIELHGDFFESLVKHYGATPV